MFGVPAVPASRHAASAAAGPGHSAQNPPSPTRKGHPMIYELRKYRCVPGRLPAVLSRFQNHTLRIWEKHGIRQAGFWTTLVGESSQQLTYMLAWDSLAEREKRWNAFRTDPEWLAIAAETEKDGQIVENISNELLAPTAFSSVN